LQSAPHPGDFALWQRPARRRDPLVDDRGNAMRVPSNRVIPLAAPILPGDLPAQLRRARRRLRSARCECQAVL